MDFVALQRLREPINDLVGERAPVCRRRFDELVSHPLWQTELNPIRGPASCCRFFIRGATCATDSGKVAFFLATLVSSKGQAARNCASMKLAKQSDNSGVIEDVTKDQARCIRPAHAAPLTKVPARLDSRPLRL